MNTAHSNKVALNGVNIINQMKRQKGDVYVFPADGFNQIEQSFTQLDQLQIVHTKNLYKIECTKICRSRIMHFHSVINFLTPIFLMTAVRLMFGFEKHRLRLNKIGVNLIEEFQQSLNSIWFTFLLNLARNRKDVQNYYRSVFSISLYFSCFLPIYGCS